MDLKSAWKNIDDQKRKEVFEDRGFILDAIRRDSKTPLDKLVRNLKIKIIWISLFILLFITMIFISKYLLVDVMIGILTLAYILALVTTLQERKMLMSKYDIDGNLLGTLKLFYNRMIKYHKYELKVAVYILPFSVATGFIFGFLLAETPEKTLNINNWWFFTVMVVYMILAIPIGLLLSEKMIKKTHGKYLDQLEANINLLEKED
ncbi:MAG: hypothetical protein AAF363_13715 [Bacteroidota bacterium]